MVRPTTSLTYFAEHITVKACYGGICKQFKGENYWEAMTLGMEWLNQKLANDRIMKCGEKNETNN